MKLIDILNELYNTPQSIKNKQKELEDLGYTKIGVGDNGIVMQKKSDVKKLTTDVDELEHAEKLVNHSFSCIIPIYKVERLAGGKSGVIDMTNAEQLAPQEAEEIAANGTKAEDFLVYDEELYPKLSDKLKQFLVSLKEAFKKAGINPDEIDWSPTNVMNYKGNYVLVDV
jgi:hypothetical protein